MCERYEHILVPLDGSELTELALADAFALAKLIQSKVTLLQVILGYISRGNLIRYGVKTVFAGVISILISFLLGG